jgi:hypothetical protein
MNERARLAGRGSFVCERGKPVQIVRAEMIPRWPRSLERAVEPSRMPLRNNEIVRGMEIVPMINAQTKAPGDRGNRRRLTQTTDAFSR